LESSQTESVNVTKFEHENQPMEIDKFVPEDIHMSVPAISQTGYSFPQTPLATPANKQIPMSLSKKKAPAVAPQQIPPRTQIPSSSTAKSSKSFEIDRPTHWITSSTKKLMKPADKAAPKREIKPKLTAPRPMQASSLPLNAKMSDRLSYQPKWMAPIPSSSSFSQKQATSSTERIESDFPEEMEENRQIAAVDSFHPPSERNNNINNNSAALLSIAAQHTKHKNKSVSLKAGSLRWKFQKFLREHESLHNWLLNPSLLSSSNVGFHDPRKRVEFSLQIQFLQNHGIFDSFAVFSVEIQKMERRKTHSSLTKRKDGPSSAINKTNSYPNDESQMETESMITTDYDKYSVPAGGKSTEEPLLSEQPRDTIRDLEENDLPKHALTIYHEGSAGSGNGSRCTAYEKYKIYDPILLPVSSLSGSNNNQNNHHDRFPWILTEIISSLPFPVEFLILSSSGWEKL
jgi:hypothetical protein